jgi:CxxC motif-containing protein (DUF1111 family)
VTKAARYTPGAGCDLLTGAGGENIRTRSTALLREHGIERERVPVEATEVARFVVPFLFGLGLAEAVPAATLEALSDPEDGDGDGISGRLARVTDGRPGRFGRKSDFATLADFNAGAFFLEMGPTNLLHSGPESVNGQLLPAGVDPAEDPEVGEETLGLVADYVRFLAPLDRRLPDEKAALDEVSRGESLFRTTGCASCHVPVLETGDHPVEALANKAVAFYSDLLLHDLGPQASGVCGPDAAPWEYRTGILMGVGLRQLFLHNGEASSLEEAILSGTEERPKELERPSRACLRWIDTTSSGSFKLSDRKDRPEGILPLRGGYRGLVIPIRGWRSGARPHLTCVALPQPPRFHQSTGRLSCLKASSSTQ